MTFEEARIKMENIAKGSYHHIEYRLTTFPALLKQYKDEVHSEALCHLYLEGGILVSGKTWAQAFAALDKALHPGSEPVPVNTEAPKEELGE